MGVYLKQGRLYTQAQGVNAWFVFLHRKDGGNTILASVVYDQFRDDHTIEISGNIFKQLANEMDAELTPASLYQSIQETLKIADTYVDKDSSIYGEREY